MPSSGAPRGKRRKKSCGALAERATLHVLCGRMLCEGCGGGCVLRGRWEPRRGGVLGPGRRAMADGLRRRGVGGRAQAQGGGALSGWEDDRVVLDGDAGFPDEDDIDEHDEGHSGVTERDVSGSIGRVYDGEREITAIGSDGARVSRSSYGPGYHPEAGRQGQDEEGAFSRMMRIIWEQFMAMLGAIGLSVGGGASAGSSAAGGVFSNPDVPVDASTQRVMGEFKEFMSNGRYDSENELHERCLMRLWELSFPEKKLESRKTKQWSDLGFQYTDPASDFRGAGIFGLRSLLFFAHYYTDVYRTLLTQSHQPSDLEAYPFAIAGLNLSMVLCGILGWGMYIATKKVNVTARARRNAIAAVFQRCGVRDGGRDIPLPGEEEEESNCSGGKATTGASASLLIDFDDGDWGNGESGSSETSAQGHEAVECALGDVDGGDATGAGPPSFGNLFVDATAHEMAFNELYCLLYLLFDAQWYEERATYMQFPEVLVRAQQRMVEVLEGINSVGDVREQVEKLASDVHARARDWG